MSTCTFSTKFLCPYMLLTFTFLFLIRWRHALLLPTYCQFYARLWLLLIEALLLARLFFFIFLQISRLSKLFVIKRCVCLFCELLTWPNRAPRALVHEVHLTLLRDCTQLAWLLMFHQVVQLGLLLITQTHFLLLPLVFLSRTAQWLLFPVVSRLLWWARPHLRFPFKPVLSWTASLLLYRSTAPCSNIATVPRVAL